MKTLALAVILSFVALPLADAGVKKGAKKAQRAQKCSARAKTVAQKTYHCPRGGSLVYTNSSHRMLKQNQLAKMVCVAKSHEYKGCPGAYGLYNLTDVKSWAGPFCNWVYQYRDGSNKRQTYACMIKPKKRK